MNDIDKLLNNYFDGISSIEEERALKRYFSDENVLPEHEAYRSLFVAFAKEKEVVAPPFEIGLNETTKKKRVKMRYIFAAITSAAAMLILVFVLFPAKQSSTDETSLVIVHGQKITDPLVAQEYADKKFAEVEKMLEESYRPYREAIAVSNDMDAEKLFKHVETNIHDSETINE